MRKQTSKCLNYLDSAFMGPYFFSFILIWTYFRHYICLGILYSMLPVLRIPLPAPMANLFNLNEPAIVLKSTPSEFATVGPYDLNWDTQQYKCWISQPITFSLLAAIQALNLFWLFLIFRIAWRFVSTLGQVAKDERSEYDTDEEEEKERKDFIAEEKAKEDKASNGPTVLLNGKPVADNTALKQR